MGFINKPEKEDQIIYNIQSIKLWVEVGEKALQHQKMMAGPQTALRDANTKHSRLFSCHHSTYLLQHWSARYSRFDNDSSAQPIS